MAQSNNNRIVVPNARDALNRFKMETANELGIQLNQGYNGEIKSRDAGTIGGNMVRKMIQAYENGLAK
ncbi:MAG: small, acid-soluble spore protein, alpha/beta type [Oscillospiraceae bacterium]|jgi:small acid-soluble spore protein D (minor alpha/beta-type SASP)